MSALLADPAPGPHERPAPSSRPPVLSGRLEDMSLLDMLRFLGASSKSGMLRLAGTFPGFVFLRDGEVAFASAEGCPDLGEAVERNETVDEFEALVAGHVADIVFELMVLCEGTFEFVAGECDPWGGQFRIPVTELVAEVERRVGEWKQIASAIPSMSAVPRLRPRLAAGAPEAVVSADEWRVLALLDGCTTVAGMVAASGMRPFEACRALHGLAAKGLIAS
ncbi:MAG: DUF4388 domain-containing protein [Acidimicrobiales bacterium]